MILEEQITAFILSLGLINAVTGSSYSNVYVGSQSYPLLKYSHAAPYTSLASPRLAEINSLPANLPAYVACVSPCTLPEQSVAAVNPSPSVLRYNSQPYASVPVVVSPVAKEEAAGYEYSYAIYDDGTGDHKAQRELSDGTSVKGEYSFLQPDGLVREVQYVADDAKGFNAVVKNFLPIALKGKKHINLKETKEPAPPSNEIKKESLIEASKESENIAEVHHSNHGPVHSLHKDIEIANSQDHKSAAVDEHGIEHSDEPNHGANTNNEKKTGIAQEHSLDAKHIREPEHSNKQENESKPHLDDNLKKASIDKSKNASQASQESHEEPKNKFDNNSKKENPSVSKEIPKNSSGEHSGKKTTEADLIHLIETLHKGAELQAEHHVANDMTPPNEHDVLVPYNDLIRCVQAALKKANGRSAAIREEPSLLTYIVFNKPC